MAADVELIGAVRAALRGAAQPGLAGPMQAYMKSATPYLGVRVPVTRALTRTEAKQRPFATTAELIDTVLGLWRAADYREERYAAIALLDTPAARRLRDPSLLTTLRELILTGAWWDYVDELAHRVGDLLLGWTLTSPGATRSPARRHVGPHQPVLPGMARRPAPAPTWRRPTAERRRPS